MDPICFAVLLIAVWLPRASGDGPQREKANKRWGKAPPRERGWTP